MELRIVTVPVSDTGLGREAGYKDDAELVAAYEAMLDDLDPTVRDMVLELDTELALRFVLGSAD